MFSKLSIFVLHALLGTVLCLSTHNTATAAERATPSSPQPSVNATRQLFVPVDPQGDVAVVYLPSTTGTIQTRLYYQDPQGNIREHNEIGGPFTIGFNQGSSALVRTGFSRPGTPIAAAGGIGKSFHIFYVTTSNTLGETRFANGQWQGGSFGGCPQCIDSARLLVAEGSQVLYAIKEPNDENLLRVGFESTGAPGTISEAVSTNFGRTWQVAPFPN